MPLPKPPTIYSPRTASELAVLSKKHKDLQVIADLGKELQLPASKWTYRHLIAYRLLVKPETSFLNILNDDHEVDCPVCKPKRESTQEVDGAKIRALTKKRTFDITKASESELMQQQDGSFWVALSQAIRPDVRDAAMRASSQRKNTKVTKEGFVNSTTAIPGDSSPSSKVSSDEYQLEMEGFDEDDYDERRNKPEGTTVQLIGCFLRYTLTSGLVQDVKRQEVRVRLNSNKAMAVINKTTVKAEDDGKISLLRRHSEGWQETNPFLALIEAKRAFQSLAYNDNAQYEPIVSDRTLAQYLGETVITWKANQKLLGKNVFLIAATNTFVRFVHFRFGNDYAGYLDTNGAKNQRAFVRRNNDAFVRMQCTEWFDLNTAIGRLEALCHVLALLRWHDNREEEEDSDSDSDSDSNNDSDSE